MLTPGLENKMDADEALERKAPAAAPVRHRCPTGELDAAVYAQVLDAGTHGAVA